MLEAHGVVVAPSLEFNRVAEVQRLAGAGAVAGNLFALDIEASVDMLEEETQFASRTVRVRLAHGIP
jgi:hypothetical protein